MMGHGDGVSGPFLKNGPLTPSPWLTDRTVTTGYHADNPAFSLTIYKTFPIRLTYFDIIY